MVSQSNEGTVSQPDERTVSQSDESTSDGGAGEKGSGDAKITTNSLSLAQIAEEVEQAVGGRIIGEEEVESVKQVSE